MNMNVMTEYASTQTGAGVQGELLQTLTGRNGSVSSLTWSPDGERLACGTADNSLCFWDWQRGELQLMLTAQRVDPAALWSPDGEMFAAGLWSRTVSLWDAVRALRCGMRAAGP